MQLKRTVPTHVFPILLLLLYITTNAFASPLQPCTPCLPGWGLTRLCSPSRPTLCHVCPVHTYSPREPHLAECTPCSICGEGLYEEKKCKRNRDTKCDSCDTLNGRYNADFIKKCMKTDRIGHEKSGSLLERLDQGTFDIELNPSKSSESYDYDLPFLDSDEEFWKNVDFEEIEKSKGLDSEIENDESGPKQSKSQILGDEKSKDSDTRIFLPNPISNLPRRALSNHRENDDSSKTTGFPKNIGSPLDFGIGSKKMLPGLFESEFSGSYLDFDEDSMGNSLNRDPIDLWSDENNSEKEEPTHKFLVDPFDSHKNDQDAWSLRKLIPFWSVFDSPPKDGNKDLHHSFVKNDGQQLVPHQPIPVKPSVPVRNVQWVLSTRHPRYCILSVLALAAIVGTVLFTMALWRWMQTRHRAVRHPRCNCHCNQRLQLQLSPGDKQIIKECAAKLDYSQMFDRPRSRSPDVDREPLIVNVHTNPMDLLRYLEHSSTAEHLSRV